MKPMKTVQKNYLLIFWITLIDFFLLDFATKRWAVMDTFQPMQIIDGVFYFTNYHKNDGIAFGIDLPFFLQILGSLVILYMLINLVTEHFHERTDAHFQMLLLGAIIGGGLGNLVDRLTNGFVVDFIVLRPFPIFNVADLGITVGLALLFVTILLDQKKSKN